MIFGQASTFLIFFVGALPAVASTITFPAGGTVETRETIILSEPGSIFTNAGRLTLDLDPPSRVGVLATEDARDAQVLNTGPITLLRAGTTALEARGRNATVRNTSTIAARSSGQTAIRHAGISGSVVNDGVLTGTTTTLGTIPLDTGIALDSQAAGRSTATNNGRIDANAGVVLSGFRPRLVNAGQITGRAFGVVVQNLETSSSPSDAGVFNAEDGIIEGAFAAIEVNVPTALRGTPVFITNRGVIRTSGSTGSAVPAIRGGGTSEQVVNSSLIVGDIELGNGNDTVELRLGGRVEGDVRLGNGFDTFVLGESEPYGGVNFAAHIVSGGPGIDLFQVGGAGGPGSDDRIILLGDRVQEFENMILRRETTDAMIDLRQVLRTGVPGLPLTGTFLADRGTLFFNEAAGIETGFFNMGPEFRLIGNGTILAQNIFIDGRIEPGGSAGVLAFDGPTTLGPNAEVLIEVFEDGFDRLLFGGPVTVAETSMFTFAFDTVFPDEARGFLDGIDAADIFSLTGQSIADVFGTRVFDTNLFERDGAPLTLSIADDALVLRGRSPAPIPLPESGGALVVGLLALAACRSLRGRCAARRLWSFGAVFPETDEDGVRVGAWSRGGGPCLGYFCVIFYSFLSSHSCRLGPRAHPLLTWSPQVSTVWQAQGVFKRAAQLPNTDDRSSLC